MSDAEAVFGAAAVVDASVALKWILPEANTESALRLRDRLRASGTSMHVPDLFWVECANVLWRLTRPPHHRIEAGEARALLEVLRTAPLFSTRAAPLAGRALEIACATGATAYDAAYVAVAEILGARLWTADGALVSAVAGTEWEGLVARLSPST